MSDDPRDAAAVGEIQWHCSEEDGGPDVGMTLGLGDGKIMWVGEITNRAYRDAGDDAAELGGDGGWWLSLYPTGEPAAKFLNTEAAREFFDLVAAAVNCSARLIASRDAEIATLRERLEWRDISTAPKDGSTIVDLWCVHPNLPAQRSANMVYRRGKWVTAGIIVEPLNPGWTATHWLPLPTTPTPKESKSE